MQRGKEWEVVVDMDQDNAILFKSNAMEIGEAEHEEYFRDHPMD